MAEPLNIRKMRAALRKELQKVAFDVQNDARAVLREKGRKSTGDLINSIRARVRSNPKSLSVFVGPTVSYGWYVEDGTKPHWVPISALRDWIVEKFRGRYQGRDLDAFAYGVQRKIAKEGTEATEYMEEAYKKQLPTIAQRVADALVQAL